MFSVWIQDYVGEWGIWGIECVGVVRSIEERDDVLKGLEHEEMSCFS